MTSTTETENQEIIKCVFCDNPNYITINGIKADRVGRKTNKTIGKVGSGGFRKIRKYEEFQGYYIHCKYCYNRFSGNFRFNRNTNNYKVERLLRQNNKNWLIRGRKMITGKDRRMKHITKKMIIHYDKIGIKPKMFYKWFEFLIKFWGMDKDLILLYDIGHFVPLRAEEVINYDKNKWYNLIPQINSENKEQKAKMPDKKEFFNMKCLANWFKRENGIM